MSNYIVLKLISGESLICEKLYENQHEITIRDPLEVKYVQMKIKDTLVEKSTIYPFCSLSQEKCFTLNKNAIVFTNTLKEDIKQYYFDVLDEMEKQEIEKELEEEQIKTVKTIDKSFH